MWAIGFTPKVWKTSNTIIIDKNKGDETEVPPYRPVGLQIASTDCEHVALCLL